MSGHKGQLSEQQQKAYEDVYSQLLSDHQQHVAHVASLQRKTDNPITIPESEFEYELLRFLRASKWDVTAAVAKYRDYLTWRKQNNIDTILDQPHPKQQLWNQVLPNAYHGYDKNGQPLYIEKTGLVNVSAALSTFTDEDIKQLHAYQNEWMSYLCREQSRKLGKKIETSFIIMDLKGLNMSHRKAMYMIQIMTEIDQKYNPESLGTLYIINAPWVFPVLWNIAKGWLDPVTRSKIVILKGDYHAKLLEHFDLDQLPEEYGGTCNKCPIQPCLKEYDISDILKTINTGNEDMELISEQIKAGKSFTKSISVAHNSLVGWYFKTGAHDVAFGVEFVGKDGTKETIVKSTRVNAAEIPVQGSYTVTKDGTIEFVWSNQFSYFKGKQINYCITVSDMSNDGIQVVGQDSNEIDAQNMAKDDEKECTSP